MEVIVMTITSNPASPLIEELDVDQRPGSSDVAWAERAYHHQRQEAPGERRRTGRVLRRRLRVVIATLALVILMIGLVVTMRYSGSSPSPVTHRSTSSQTVTAPRSTTAGSPFTLTTPLLRPFPSLPPTIDIPRH
jgi:hypothetical protein